MKNKMFYKIFNFFRIAPSRQSKNKSSSVVMVPATEEFERCIICGKLTDVSVSMPINLRTNYEIGIGQLCNECGMTLQKEEKKQCTLSDTQILTVVEQSRDDKN